MAMSEWAAAHAEALLGDADQRWDHIRGVASRAQELTARLELPDGDALVAAAYLHDVGYSPDLADSGFHPLDGARHLRELGEERLARLVAHHGGADEEASLRGLADELDAFVAEDTLVARALDYCDLTVGPNCETMTPAERFDEVEARYGAEHIVTRGLRLAWPRLEGRLAEVAELLKASASDAQPR
jgi:HD superfamily phosphodiesterase